MYAFGYGLSYTRFEYSDLRVTCQNPSTYLVSFKVRNIGNYDGEEVAQLYLRDEYASTIQPLKQLKHFERFFLRRGEMKEVRFVLDRNDFSVLNTTLKQVVELGDFLVMIGASSDDIRLQTVIEIPCP